MGQHIPGSLFKLKVHPGPNAGAVKAMDLAWSLALKQEMWENSPLRRKMQELVLSPFKCTGTFKIIAELVKDDDLRTLRTHYDPKEPGDYIVAVRWSGTHIPGSPFNVNIGKKPKSKKVMLPTLKEVEGFDPIPESDGEDDEEAEEGSPSKQKKKEKKEMEKEKEKGKKSSKSPKRAENGAASAQQQQQLLQLSPGGSIPAFPVSPARGVPHQMIQQGGLMASRSQVIQE